jgi:hypothetical protein
VFKGACLLSDSAHRNIYQILLPEVNQIRAGSVSSARKSPPPAHFHIKKATY